MSDPYSQDYRPQQPSYGTSQISPENERMWGALAHASAVVAMVLSAGFLGFVGSVLVFMLYKDRGPFVRAHAANSINVQITMFIWLVVLTIAAVVIGILTLGLALIVLLPLLAIAPFVAGALHVIGAVKAYNGEWWEPPLTPKFVS